MDSLAMVSGTAVRLTGNKTRTRPTGQKGSTKKDPDYKGDRDERTT